VPFALSPDLAFILIFALRMVIAAAFVVTASVITERAGPAIGALVATLPISAGPSYIFLSLDHDALFIAQSALASLPVNAATVVFGLIYIVLAQRHGSWFSLGVGIVVWSILVLSVRLFAWSLTAGLIANAVAFAVCLPLVQRYRAVKMPLITRRWYDIPLRATMVAVLVATVVGVSNLVGPTISGIFAIFPIVFVSLMLILHPRIGGPPTAAVIANGLWGLIGFGTAIAVLHLAALHLGSAPALCLALATCVGWNLGLWGYERRRPVAN